MSALGALALRARASRLGLLLIGVALVGAAHFQSRTSGVPAERLALSSQRDQPLAVEGVALENAIAAPGSQGRLAAFLIRPSMQRFRLKVRRVLDPNTFAPIREASGTLHVMVSGADVNVRSGDRVRVVGLARAVAPPLNPGQTDARAWAHQSGVVGRLIVGASESITPSNSAEGLFERLERRWLAWRGRLRARASIVDDSPERSAGADLLAALVLGARDPSTREVRDDFTRVGLAHMLSVSGLHLAALAFAALLALRLTGDYGWREPLIVCALILLYLAIVPARTPVMRAAAMTLALLAAQGAGRRHDRLSLLALVGVAILIWRPMELFSAGFQLSFGVVAGFLIFSRRVEERMFGPRADPDHEPITRRMARRLVGAGGAAVIAQVVSVPIVAFHFGVVSPYAWIATLLLAPVILPLLCAAYVVMLIALLSPGTAQALLPPIEAMAGTLAWAGDQLEALPGSFVRIPPVGLAWTIVALLVGCWWLWSGSLRRPAPTIALAIVIGWLALLARADGLPSSVVARIDTFAVGDGTCHLLRSDGEAMLWDCGSLDLDIGERTIPEALRALGVYRVGTMIISHPDIDHYSAAIDVAEATGVRRVLVGASTLDAAAAAPRGAVAHALDELRRRGVEIQPVHAGDSWRIGRVRLDVIWPPEGLALRRENDASLVARATAPTSAGQRTALFTGDIQDESIARLLVSDADVRAQVVEAPHHGSARPLAFAFVEETRADIVVQSTGEGRAGDERWDDVKRGRIWWTTAVDGAASVTFEEDGALRTWSVRDNAARRIRPSR